MSEVTALPEAPAVAPEQATITTPAEGTAAPEGGSPTPQEAKPERSFTQAELDKIVEKRLSKERLRAEKEWTRRQAELLTHLRPGEQPAKPSDSRPQREAYQDYEQYLEALTDWKADQKIRESETRRQGQSREEQIRQYQANVQREYQGRVEAARTKYEDFDDLVSDPSLPITVPMAQVIAESEMGPDIAYYLAKNRPDAERIARLSPARAAIELGKIEAKLASAPAPKAPSKAPAPIEPVGGTSNVPNSPDPDKNFGAWMKAEQRKEGKLAARK